MCTLYGILYVVVCLECTVLEYWCVGCLVTSVGVILPVLFCCYQLVRVGLIYM